MILLLLLLPLASAQYEDDGLVVNIKPAPTEAKTTIAHRGTDVKLLTDQEKNIFHLTEDNLKKAVEILSHQKPTDVFIRATPGKDLYKTYNWHEVKRDFKLKSIKVVNLTTTVDQQSEKVYTNNGTERETVKADVAVDYPFGTTHNWNGDIVSATVEYELVRPGKVDVDSAYGSKVGEFALSSGLTSLSYGEIKAKFDLNPGESAKFITSASTVTIEVKIEYETRLTGDVVVKYADRYRGKEVWAYDVNKLLDAVNMTTVAETHELLTVRYKKDYPVKVVDVATGKEIVYTDLVYPDH